MKLLVPTSWKVHRSFIVSDVSRLRERHEEPSPSPPWPLLSICPELKMWSLEGVPLLKIVHACDVYVQRPPTEIILDVPVRSIALQDPNGVQVRTQVCTPTLVPL